MGLARQEPQASPAMTVVGLADREKKACQKSAFASFGSKIQRDTQIERAVNAWQHHTYESSE